MNNPKSVIYGWVGLIVAAGGSYYFARKQITAQRLEHQKKGRWGAASQGNENIGQSGTSSGHTPESTKALASSKDKQT
ncbi:hypothetical protein FRC18_004578 [Serendipita sp. 400]|nr:hypothetical protein FRC18_004578 [Serendipita sp. 400]